MEVASPQAAPLPAQPAEAPRPAAPARATPAAADQAGSLNESLDQLYGWISRSAESLGLEGFGGAAAGGSGASGASGSQPPRTAAASNNGGSSQTAAGGVSSFRSLSHSFSDFISNFAPGGDCTNVLETRCSPERRRPDRRGAAQQPRTQEAGAGAGAGAGGQSPDPEPEPGHEDVSVVLYPEDMSIRAQRAPSVASKPTAEAEGGEQRQAAYPWPEDAPVRPSSSPKTQPEEIRQTASSSQSPKHARLTSSGNLRPIGSERRSAAYDADPEDLLDQHVAYYLRHHKDVAAQHSVNRLCPGVYAIDDREVRVEWQHALEPGGQGFLVVVDGPLRQPFADYMEHSENNAEYDVQGIGVDTSLHSIPREKRMSFHDTHKVYSRLEAMKVAKEQALVRERAADYTKDGREVPRELLSKYKKQIALKLDQSGQRRKGERRTSGMENPKPAPPALEPPPAAGTNGQRLPQAPPPGNPPANPPAAAGIPTMPGMPAAHYAWPPPGQGGPTPRMPQTTTGFTGAYQPYGLPAQGQTPGRGDGLPRYPLPPGPSLFTPPSLSPPVGFPPPVLPQSAAVPPSVAPLGPFPFSAPGPM